MEKHGKLCFSEREIVKSPFQGNGNNKIDLAGDCNCVQRMKDLREENMVCFFRGDGGYCHEPVDRVAVIF